MKQTVNWDGRKFSYNHEKGKWIDAAGEGPDAQGEHYMLYGLAGLNLNKKMADQISEEKKFDLLATGFKYKVPIDKMLNILYPNAKEGEHMKFHLWTYTRVKGKWLMSGNDEGLHQWLRDKAWSGYQSYSENFKDG